MTAPSSGSSRSRSRCAWPAPGSGATLMLALAERIDQAEAELRAALADLRELAQGIFPVMLAEEGLVGRGRGAGGGGPARPACWRHRRARCRRRR